MDFERLCFEVAIDLDSLRDPWLYGKPGEDQDAIDFYGDAPAGRATYQVRRLAEDPTPALIREAVNDFRTRGDEFAAKRFVLCVRGSARSVHFQKELRKLREASGFQIDIYDEERLSLFLRDQPRMVRRFFGPGWPELICGEAPQGHADSVGKLPVSSPDPVEAILRGPVTALGLQDRLAQAESEGDRAAAADIYGDLAEAVDTAGYSEVARRLRWRQAEALDKAGSPAKALRIWLMTAVENVDTRPQLAAIAWGQVQKRVGELAPEDRQLATALQAKLAWFEIGTEALQSMKQALTEAEANAETRSFAALAFSESCLADDRLDQLEGAEEAIARIGRETGGETGLRIEMVLADRAGDWQSLLARARNGMASQSDCGWIFVRYGRWLVRQARPQDAIGAFREAISPLTRAHQMGDVAEALFSLVATKLEYGEFGDLDDFRAIAIQLRHERKRIAADRDFEVASTENLNQGNLAEAHNLARHALWLAVVSAHTTDEDRLRERLGDLYRRAGMFDDALANYIRAGEASKAAETVISARSSLPIELIEDEPRARILGTRITALAAQADLLSEPDASTAFRLLARWSAGVPQGPFTPIVSDEAVKAIAKMALQLSEADAEHALEIFEARLDRADNTFRRFDDEMVQGLVDVWRRHPSLRPRAVAGLVRALCQSHIGQRAIQPLAVIIGHESDGVDEVRARASKGCLDAVYVLAGAGVSDPTVAREAKRRLQQVLAEEPHSGISQWGVGAAYEQIVAFAAWLPPRDRARLGRHLLLLASSATAASINSASAVAAVGLLGSVVSTSLRREWFDAVWPLTVPRTELVGVDLIAQQSQHPFSRFRLNFGEGTLPHSALLASARLASTRKDAALMNGVVANLLASGRTDDTVVALSAIGLLDQRLRPNLDLEPWTRHGDVRVRRVAAWLWSQDRSASTALGVTMASTDVLEVRMVLARSLEAVAARSAETALILQEIFASDASAEIRQQAREVVLKQQEPRLMREG